MNTYTVNCQQRRAAIPLLVPEVILTITEKNMMKKLCLFAVLITACISNSPITHAQSRTAFVHLFEWSWNDIAIECEQNLGPKGFAAVQVSPPQKSITRSEWWSRYQPLSYEITGRGGSRNQFRNMVNRCKAVGVDIYVDAVINHMAALDRSFPEVPYGPNDFHNCTDDIDYGNRFSVQNCDLVGLNDLKTESNYVRQKIADYMNDLIGLGVAGFRIDASKHIPVQDIAAIKSKLNQSVYIFQEVIGAPGEPVQPREYTGVGDVTEFNFERTLGFYFKGRGPLKDLRNIRTFQGWLPSDDAVVFVSNHDDQRQNTNNTLTYKDPGDLYYIGEIFSLAYPYGYPKVMSSYFFSDHDQGPPANGVHSGDACGVNWVCEHRWRGVANMVAFRNATQSQFRLTNWWDNGNNQIAFGRGGLGFVAINREDNSRLNRSLQTGMPAGQYCDVVNGEFDNSNGSCEGPVITVGTDGVAQFDVRQINASAIHVNAKLSGQTGDTSAVDITFQCNQGATYFGQSVYAIGNIPELGNWNRASAVKLDPVDYPVWKKVIKIPKNKDVKWKCLKREEGNPNQGIQWEPGADNAFTSNQSKTTIGSF